MKIRFHKFIKFFSICCLAPLPPIIGLTSCSSIKIADIKCEHNTIFGGCLIDIAPEEFERKGFSLGAL